MDSNFGTPDGLHHPHWLIVTRFPSLFPDQTQAVIPLADRFFTDSPIVDSEIQLSDDQAHHVANVMRAGVGDALTLFDADGNEYQTEITSKSKKRVTVKKLSSSRPERKLQRSITILVALPKGDRQKFLIEKLVELGVQRLIPLNTARSVAQVNEKVLGRLNKQIIEATKQCRRSYLMDVLPAVSIAEAVAMAANATEASYFVAHPYTDQKLASVKQRLAESKSIVWLVGPEGGFSDEEFTQLKAAGWSPVSFGKIIQRVETAAISAAAISGMGAEE